MNCNIVVHNELIRITELIHLSITSITWNKISPQWNAVHMFDNNLTNSINQNAIVTQQMNETMWMDIYCMNEGFDFSY